MLEDIALSPFQDSLTERNRFTVLSDRLPTQLSARRTVPAVRDVLGSVG
ncbi:hypothetical protein ACIRO3_35550 [Streptomyces sp. NPDC102278]